MPSKLARVGVGLVVGLAVRGAAGQTSDSSPAGIDRAGGPSTRSFRETLLVWDNSVTAQTLGLGKSYQSANPTYETSLSLRPRYYLVEREGHTVYLAGRVDLVHEFTNSDVTTRRGETTLTDATLLAAYRRTLHRGPGHATLATAALPVLTLPTSKFSYSNGTLLGLGAELRLSHEAFLTGESEAVLRRVSLAAIVGYQHTFTRAVVPIDPDLHRLRLDPEGRTVPGDQLTGAAFPAHELRLSARLVAGVTDRLRWLTEFSYRPTWKYGFADDVRVCGVVSTGCSTVTSQADPVTYLVVTAFETAVSYDVIDALAVAVGYVNVEQQPGLDGQRRNVFYAPGAQLYLSLIGYLDAVAVRASGTEPGASSR